jgi:hypothetical protein
MTFVIVLAPVEDCRLGKGYSLKRPPDSCGPFCTAADVDAANRDGRDCGLTRADLVVSRLYDLSKPGKYAIQVTRPDLGSRTLVKSNAVTVTITP